MPSQCLFLCRVVACTIGLNSRFAPGEGETQDAHLLFENQFCLNSCCWGHQAWCIPLLSVPGILIPGKGLSLITNED
jgi:hypothetical protein